LIFFTHRFVAWGNKGKSGVGLLGLPLVAAVVELLCMVTTSVKSVWSLCRPVRYERIGRFFSVADSHQALSQASEVKGGKN
jgi:hypothetical protein